MALSGMTRFGFKSMQLSDNKEAAAEAIVKLGRGVDTRKGRPPCNKRPKTYTNWFTPELWPPIDAALKRYGRSAKAVVSHLQKFFVHKYRDNPYLQLNESTVRGWFKFNSKGEKIFRPSAQVAIDMLQAGYSKKEIASWRYTSHLDTVWNGHKELEIEFINLLNELMDALVGFNSVIIQFQLKAFLQVRCLEILPEADGTFDISRNFVKKWVKDRLGWSYKKLLPTGNQRSFRLKGCMDVAIQGQGDKRMITIMVSSNAEGFMLPAQVIFEAETLQEFVEKLLAPWIVSTCTRLGLNPQKQRSVWIIDCYSVHLRKDFMEWMKLHYPLILLLFVPASTTSKLQPADVNLMRPFKSNIERQFGLWAMAEIAGKLGKGIKAENATLENRIGPLRKKFCEWLLSAQQELEALHMNIRRGWEKIGFHAAWSITTQMRAVEMNANQQLFNQDEAEHEELTHAFDTEWSGDITALEALEYDSFLDDVPLDSQAEQVFDYADLFSA
ncbi:hypothetical protein R1sor_001431 [Riccia sorocarpa]|uniref:DDE-1 domain-containing protein n=1 Tax=Riccia sorocarpa TaxID=122646 RepID=A0ABD3GZV9_9MARC